MTFKYVLDNSAGWACVVFKSESFSKIYLVSNIGSDIRRLLGGLIAIFDTSEKSKIHYDLKEQYLDENGLFKWHINQEGSEIGFIFSLTDDVEKINIEIIEYDVDVDGEKSVFNEEVDSFELLGNIIESCDEMLAKYGIIGYYNNFWSEFPILYFLLLKNYDKQQLVFDTFEEMCPHNRVEKMDRTDLNVELKYLSCK